MTARAISVSVTPDMLEVGLDAAQVKCDAG